jgi:hypothetical protein
MRDLVKKLLTKDPKKRMENISSPDGIMTIKYHPFFKAVSWDDILARREKAPFVPSSEQTLDSEGIANQAELVKAI